LSVSAISTRKRSFDNSAKWPKKSRLKCDGSSVPGLRRSGRYFGNTATTASSKATITKPPKVIIAARSPGSFILPSTNVSTIDETRLVEWKKHFDFADEDKETLKTQRLTEILDANLAGSNIDLLTIDVEGHDMQVLRGLDFAKYRPKIIIIEMHEFREIESSDIYRHLTSIGYELKYFAILNAYFVDAGPK